MSNLETTCDYYLQRSDGMTKWVCTNCHKAQDVPFLLKDWNFCPYCGKRIRNKEGIKNPMDD